MVGNKVMSEATAKIRITTILDLNLIESAHNVHDFREFRYRSKG